MSFPGRPGVSPRLAYIEWCAPPPEEACHLGENCEHTLDSEGCAMDNSEMWQRSNPAMGRRISEQYIADERQALAAIPQEFGRERLGWWDEPEELLEVFGHGKWARCAIEPGPMPTEGVTVGLAVSIDREWTSFGAGARVNGRRLVGAVKRSRGTGGAVDEAVRLHQERGCTIVLDGKGPGADLIGPLQDAGIPLVEDHERVPKKGGLVVATTTEYLDACASVYDGVQLQEIAHMNHQELDDAVRGAQWRPVGDRRAWGRKHSMSDVSMLEAVTLADWGSGLPRGDAEPWAYFI